MKIIEYEAKYLEDVKDLLVELEKYIISIDSDNLDNLNSDYREKMAVKNLKYVYGNDGKCFLAVNENKVIGMIMGCITKYDEFDYLDYKCPKRGEVVELIVTSKVRSSGIGKMLMNTLEDYFKSAGCEYIITDVFAYNENAIKFYSKMGFHNRMHTIIKKI